VYLTPIHGDPLVKLEGGVDNMTLFGDVAQVY
jgi:hypothetical protein